MAGNRNSGRRTISDAERLEKKRLKWRSDIQTSQIVNALQNHTFGKNKMSATQIQAGLGLLKKILPDSTESKVEFEDVTNRVVNANPVTDEDWEKEYGNGLKPNGNGKAA